MSEYLQCSQNFITAVDEFDFLERLKISAIMQYFQDLATTHATQIGVGFEEMQQRNLFWILSRLSFKIDSFPSIGDTINVTTYPRVPGLVDSTRDYFITKNGKSILRGTSKWCVLDTNTHAIRRCAPQFKYEADRYYPSENYENGNQKIADISEIANNAELAFSSAVRITDLDRNKHMNNARYGDIVLNSCDVNFLANHSVKEFDINFVSELKMGDSFDVLRATKDDCTYFQGSKKDDKKTVVFRAKVKWNGENEN